MASRLTGALQGAASGAGLGSAVGGPGIGTAVGAGVGAIGGLISGGESDAERMQRERMEELMRRQELGTLGLTGQEMQVALGQAQGARSQQQQAQRAQQAGLLASQDLGAGAVFRAQQEEASLRRREMEGDRQEVVQRDIAEKRAQEQELVQLAALEQQRVEQERAAMLQAVTEGAVQVARAKELGFLQGQAQDVRDQQARKRAEAEDAAVKSAQRARSAAYGNQDVGSIESSPTMIGAQPAGSVVAAQPMSTGRAADGLFPVGGSLGPSFLAENAEASLLRSGLDPALIDQLMLRAGGNPDVLREYIMRTGGQI